jgi:hypothetical protein
MLTATEILSTLDNCCENQYCYFVTLSHPYTYLIDSRINIFRGTDDKWAIASEVLGYTSRSDAITLEITYFGNCLKNLESCNELLTNSYRVIPVDCNNFDETVDYEVLKPEANFWIVRGVRVPLSHK